MSEYQNTDSLKKQKINAEIHSNISLPFSNVDGGFITHKPSIINQPTSGLLAVLSTYQFLNNKYSQ